MITRLQIVKYLRKYLVFIAVGFLAALIVAASYGAWEYLNGLQGKEAQTALYSIEKKFLAIKPDAADRSQLIDPIRLEFENLLTKHKGTVAAGNAALYAAEIHLEQKNFEGALSLLNQALSSQPNAGLVPALLKMKLSTVLADLDKCAEAEKLWGQMVSDASVQFLHGEAQLRWALCLMERDPSQAKEKLQELALSGGSDNQEMSLQAKRLLRKLNSSTGSQVN